MAGPGADEIDVRVLGPLELVSPAGTTTSVGGSLRLALLARLVIASGQVVTADRLIDDLWHGRPPSSAATALRVHASHVRRTLDATIGSDGATVLVHRHRGYALELAPERVDARRFEDTMAAARVAALATNGEGAVDLVDEALARWRGPAYANVVGWSFVAAEAARLEELRLLALEERATWRLAIGQHVELVPELAQLVEAHPLRERLWGLRMLALYRCGRQTEALRAYQEARRHLVDHVGVEPSPELRGLERSILDHEPTLLRARTAEPPARPLTASGSQPASPLPPAITRHASQPFAGRKAELDRLIEELAHCGGGSVCFVVLEGEPGIGKTRLAVELAQHAAGSGAVTLYGRCDEEPVCSYQPFVEALHAYVAACPPDVLSADLTSAGAEVLRLVPQLHHRSHGLPAQVTGDPEGDRFRLFTSFSALVSTIAARTPVVLIVDDLHWADQPTLLLLRHLLRAPLSRVMVVVTLRTTEADDELVDAVLSGSHRECCVSRLHLEGLEPEAVGDLVFSLTRSHPGASVIGDLRHRTGGNPLFIKEVSLEALACGLPPGAGSPVPRGVKDGIRHRLRRLSPTTKRWLDAAAVAGERFAAPVIGRLLELSEEELLEAREESLSAEVVTTMPGSLEVHRFTHALVREVLYSEIEPSRRARLHRDLARIVEQVGAPPGADVAAEVAHHLSAAARAGIGDAGEAGAWAARAAARAMVHLSYEGAAAHLENALSLLDVHADVNQRCELLLRLGKASSRGGDLTRSRHAFEEAAALARDRSPEQLARAAVGYCGVSALGMVDQPDDVAWCLLVEASRMRTQVTDVLRVQLLSRLAREAHYRQDRHRCLQLSREVIGVAARVDDPRAAVIALFNRRWRFADVAELHEQVDVSSQLLDRTADAEPGEVAFLARQFRVGTLLQLGDVAGVRGEVEACRALATRLRQPLYEDQVRRFDTMLALLDGRFADVRTLLATPPFQAAFADVSVIGNQLLILWWLTGGLEDAAGPAAAMAADRPWLPVYQAASALIDAELGHTSHAEERFDLFIADQLPHLPDDENWLLTLTLLAYAAARLARPDACVQLRRLLQPYARRTVVVGGGDATLGSAGLAVAGLLAASGERQAAVRQLEAALDDNVRLGARPFAVLTGLELGRLLHGARDRRARVRAKQVLEAAMTDARLLDMAPAVEKLELLLG